MIRDATGRFGYTPSLVVVVSAAAVVALVSVSSGAYPLSVADILRVLAGRDASDPVASMVLLDVRLPRFLLGFLVGAVLSVSGALLQGLFRNPLADPGLIGVSAGASLAAIAVIVLGGTWLGGWLALFGEWALPVAAFLGGSATVLLAWRIAHRAGQSAVATLLLAGIAINAVAGAATGLLTFYATDDELRSLTFWTMGSLGHAGWDELLIGAPFMVLAILVAPWLARPLDAFLLGESVVGHLGYRPDRVKKSAILVVGLGVGAAVAVSGLIGFVGLVVPHLVRQLLGASHRVVLPFSALVGGTLLVAADSLARVVVAPAELPIGLMMALIGGPFFLGLLMRRKVM
ncbi:iron ABC transporter permease [Marinobacter daepoensis]|uniref:Iron ABC transporter permease n=1 Tax=Marinobacter daepoensis TaxID=262077 RepID=A0ABS3BH15_9GAMM|nr:iron ABC transporter permease [Marinobacter daepoensis]MBN7770782.1 iron ABC transporter permease [Marinobacter daepoensis]MBY6078643.1 iron ABC transporter permease [Marinobacter daepoensis]